MSTGPTTARSSTRLTSRSATPWRSRARQITGLPGWLLDRFLYRLPVAETLPIQLTRRRVFVLPGGAGLAWAMALLVMLIASINYNLSLGYALVFLLFGVALASVFHGFRNLHRLSIERVSARPVFAGEPAVFEFWTGATPDRARHAIRIRTHSVSSEPFSTSPSSPTCISLPLQSRHRGWLPAGRITIETRYPLGLTRVWSIIVPDSACLVYPAPEANPPAIPAGSGQHGKALSQQDGDDDFSGLRQHRDADPPRHVAWKVLARQDTMMTKQFSGTQSGDIRLRWHDLPPELDTEQRLSRLTAWVLQAHRSGLVFGLELPQHSIAPASGEAHLRACLKALACHGLPDKEAPC